MQVPSMLRGESLKRLLQGAAAGAVATMFVGFFWVAGRSAAPLIGWQKSGQRSRSYRRWHRCAPTNSVHWPDAEAKQVALSKANSWKRRDEFPKEFVTLPGKSYPNSTLVDACYALLLAPKSAALK